MPKEISKVDYYNTPNAELGGNDDIVVDPAHTDEEEIETPTPKDDPAPAPKKEDLSSEELEKLKGSSLKVDNKPADKPAEKKPEDGNDDGYEIEVDDNSPLTDEDVSEVVKMAEEKGMSKEEAQAEIQRRESLLRRGMSAGEHNANKVIQQYDQEVQNHPLFATNEIKKDSMRAVDEALNRFFDPSFKERFDLYYKRDVHLLTALHRLGKPFVADTMPGKPIGGFDSGAELVEGTDAAEEARLKRMYPEQFQKK